MQSAVLSYLRHVRFESFGRDDVCPICLEALCKRLRSRAGDGQPVFELFCGHRFHPHCITRWLVTKETCPVCRRGFNDEDPVRSFASFAMRLWLIVAMVFVCAVALGLCWLMPWLALKAAISVV